MVTSMMDLRSQAAKLVAQLSSACSKDEYIGTMSTSIYETAWVSMVSKPAGSERHWLFPEAFKAVIDTQLPTGAWEDYSTEVDGILSTLAALLSLCRHKHHCKQGLNPPDILSRISRAVVWLDKKLQTWNVANGDQVGFEVIVPAIISQLENYGICLYRPPLLMELNRKRLAKFNPSMLYKSIQSTLLHSLESLDGVIDFDQLSHHKRLGSMLGSPSSTAAYLMNASIWDREAECYLQIVMRQGAGIGSGKFPSAYPSTIFELSWVISLPVSEADSFSPSLSGTFHLAR